jgi:hypothetical protein
MLKELLSGYINAQHGWAVAEQFEDTFDGDDFETQNSNALAYILETLQSLDSSILSEDSQDELDEYLTRLKEYLSVEL